MVRFRAPTKFKKVGRLSRDGWHIFWCAIHDGSSGLMEPLNCFLILKTSQSKELYTRLCSPQRPPGLLSVALIFSFFRFPLFKPTWVSEWGFDLAAFISQSESVAFKAQSWKEGGGGGDVGQKRGQYRKKRALKQKDGFGLRCDRKPVNHMKDRKLKQRH